MITAIREAQLPLPLLAALLAWAVVFATTRTMSLASLAAAGLLCGLRLALAPDPWGPGQRVVTLFCVLVAVLVAAAAVGAILLGFELRGVEPSERIADIVTGLGLLTPDAAIRLS